MVGCGILQVYNNKYKNKLNAAPDLKLYLASFEPDYKKKTI